MRTAVLSVFVLASSFLPACSGEAFVGDDESEGQRADASAPTLEVTEPARATFAESEAVVVRGFAEASGGLAEVTVNGEPAELSDDGSFSLTLELPETITLLETVAVDEHGAETVDARAVLAGTLVEQETPVSESMAVHLSDGAMSGLGDMVSSFANETDWDALARSLNPVAGAGDGCNEYRANIHSVSHGAIEVSARAASGGIRVALRIRNLRVDGQVSWRAVCLDGSTTFTLTADAYDMSALVAPGFIRGVLDVTLDDVSSQFHGFRLSASGIPDFVEDTFQSQARDRLANMARAWVGDEVPPLAREFLAEFADNELAFDVLGETIHVGARPTAVDFTERGGTIVLESSAHVPGLQGGVYLASPRSRPNPGSTERDIEMAVSADAINQVLAAIWHSGALEDALLPDEASAIGVIIGADVARTTASMLLPPVVTFDAENELSRLVLGDVVVDAFGPDDDKLVSFAISAEIEIQAGARSDGGLRLRTGASRVVAQVLERGPNVRADGPALRSLAEMLIPQVGAQVQSLFDVLVIPGLPGGEIRSPTFSPRDGYLVAGGEISFE